MQNDRRPRLLPSSQRQIDPLRKTGDVPQREQNPKRQGSSEARISEIALICFQNCVPRAAHLSALAKPAHGFLFADSRWRTTAAVDVAADLPLLFRMAHPCGFCSGGKLLTCTTALARGQCVAYGGGGVVIALFGWKIHVSHRAERLQAVNFATE